MNRLVDDCLLLIFEQMYELHDLIRCHNVCRRWRYLIEIRLAKFRYMTIYDSSVSPHFETDRVPNEVLVNLKRLQYILGHTLRWKGDYVVPFHSVTKKTFPNLKIIHYDKSPGYRAIDFVMDALIVVYQTLPLRGIIEMSHDVAIPNTTKGLKGLKIYGSFRSNYVSFRPKLKQLRIANVALHHLPAHCEEIPNLEILYLEVLECEELRRDPPLVYENLETLIVADHEKRSHSFLYELEVVNWCPKLKNAHFYLLNKTLDFTGEQFFKNPRLESLVIVFGAHSSWKWISLKTHLYKYPNLKNLALRLYPEISDSHVKELVQNLPHLVTLDLRGCENITGHSVQLIESYSKREKRSIKVHIGPRYDIPPRPRHWVGTGSNFMEAFFYQDQTPLILDNLED